MNEITPNPDPIKVQVLRDLSIQLSTPQFSINRKLTISEALTMAQLLIFEANCQVAKAGISK